MNPFEKWTPEMVQQHNASVANKSAKEVGKTESTRTDGGNPSSATVSTGQRASEQNTRQIDLSTRPNTDEQKLNKTERAYLWHLRKLNVPSLRIQEFTLKLADDCRLTVDFTYVNANGRMVFVDCKGWQREDALIKMKVAARKFPEFDFVIVKRDGAGWEETAVRS